MIKKIPVSKLALGMHIHDLDCGWLDHPFARNHFTIDDEAPLNRLQIIFDCKKSKHISPETVDLSSSDDRIKSHESFEKWGIAQARWATAHM